MTAFLACQGNSMCPRPSVLQQLGSPEVPHCSRGGSALLLSRRRHDGSLLGNICRVSSELTNLPNDALALLLRHVGIQCENTGLFLEVAFGAEDTLRALRVVGQMDISNVEPILENVENMIREKWDWALPRSLLMKSFASSHLDFQAAVLTARILCEDA